MDIRVLRYFLTVVREENISKAAQALHVTQPTLSRQMAQLEEELGTPLFVRGKHLTLTDAGVMLRRRAEEVAELMDKIEDEFASREEVGGIISIGSGVLRSSHVLTRELLAFRAAPGAGGCQQIRLYKAAGEGAVGTLHTGGTSPGRKRADHQGGPEEDPPHHPQPPVCPERDFQLAGGGFPEPGHPCRIQSDHGYDGHDEHRRSLLSGYRGGYGVLCGERAGLPPPVSGAVYSLCPCLEEIPALKRSSGQISGRVQTETGIN